MYGGGWWLKCPIRWETAGLPATPVVAGLALHGLEEVLQPGDAVWLVECDTVDGATITARLAPTGVLVLDLAVTDIGPATSLLRLATGWCWLSAWAVQRGRDIARPKRACKVGNVIGGTP